MDRWTTTNRTIGAAFALAVVGVLFVGLFPRLLAKPIPVATVSGPTLLLSWQVAAAGTTDQPHAQESTAAARIESRSALPAPSAFPATAQPLPLPPTEAAPQGATERQDAPAAPASAPLPLAASMPPSRLAAAMRPAKVVATKPTPSSKPRPAPPPVAAKPAEKATADAVPKATETTTSTAEDRVPSSGTAAALTSSVSAGEAISSAASTAPTTPPPPVVSRLEVFCTDRPPPSYPLAARRTGAEGMVTVRVVLHPDGTIAASEIDETQTSATHPALRAAALEAVRHWRCQLPTTFSGQQVVVVQPFRFQLQ